MAERGGDEEDPFAWPAATTSSLIAGNMIWAIDDLQGIRTAVRHITTSDWWRARYGEIEVRVVSHPFEESPEWGHAYAKEDEGGWAIHFRANAPRREDTSVGLVKLLHELAHCATPTDPPHAVRFFHTWLALVDKFESRETATLVREDLAEQGVPL